MALITKFPDVHNEFTLTAWPLKGFFGRGQTGFYVPLYQRPYSWDENNVEQLMDDLVTGIETMLTDENSIAFLGTVILCQEQNKKNIEPVDPSSLPSVIFNVVDGQQRISTIALFATRLYRSTKKFLNQIETNEELAEAVDILEGQLETLKTFFSFSLTSKKAKPREKPVIVRGNLDKWTLDGQDNCYSAPVSNYLAQFISSLDSGGIDIPDKRTAFGKNLKVMDKYIDAVLDAHDEKDIEQRIPYPDAKKILAHISEDLLWDYDRKGLSDKVKSLPYSDQTCNKLATTVQLSAIFHYLFDRASLSEIQTHSDDWAFDIFQSLNATGTPLTAIETLKPLVVNTVNSYGKYNGSKSADYFNQVDKLFENMDTVEKKVKLTKEFLNVFSLVYRGKPLSSHFSTQRKWLNKSYSDLQGNNEKEEFVHKLTDLASYWRNVKGFDHTTLACFHGLAGLTPDEKQTVILCVKYLDQAGHRMADTLLSRFYALIERGNSGADRAFLDVAKLLCAFFTLWRSVGSNAGLDEVYRRLLNSEDDSAPDFSWNAIVTSADTSKLKKYLYKSLRTENKVISKEDWLERASVNLKYDSARAVCKFALLVSSHDTIPDSNNPGLMKKGHKGVAVYFDYVHWSSSDLKTIEHVAPQSDGNSGWDKEIYREQLEHSVGNLTLLPTSINSSVGNRSWEEKEIYFRHLAKKDEVELLRIRDEAANKGIVLSAETLELLTGATYANHVAPIVALSSSVGEPKWDRNLIENRARRICDLLWDHVEPWLK